MQRGKECRQGSQITQLGNVLQASQLSENRADVARVIKIARIEYQGDIRHMTDP